MLCFTTKSAYLRHFGVQALAHLHTTVADERSAVQVDVHERPRLV